MPCQYARLPERVRTRRHPPPPARELVLVVGVSSQLSVTFNTVLVLNPVDIRLTTISGGFDVLLARMVPLRRRNNCSIS